MAELDTLDEDELRSKKLTMEEKVELDDLRFRCWGDLPFSGQDYRRLTVLERKLQG